MRTSFGIRAECTLLQGVWIFGAETVEAYSQDLRYGRQVEQSMQAIGSVTIMIEHPVGSRPTENVVHNRMDTLPLAFTNSWNEDRIPQAADTLERSPTELQRLVRAYLPATWGLVAVGITTSIAEIVQGGFQDKQVIVVDHSPERTRFLYNTLQSVYKEDMQVIQAVVVERSAEHSTGEGIVTSERPSSNTENRNPDGGNPDQAIGDAEDYEDDEAEEETEDSNPDSDDDGDGKEPSGVSLHSQDTHCRGGELEGASIDSSNEEYHPKGTSVWRPRSPEYVSSSKEEDEEASGPQEGQEHCTDFAYGH
jgi:hypothetical protein